MKKHIVLGRILVFAGLTIAVLLLNSQQTATLADREEGHAVALELLLREVGVEDFSRSYAYKIVGLRLRGDQRQVESYQHHSHPHQPLVHTVFHLSHNCVILLSTSTCRQGTG